MRTVEQLAVEGFDLVPVEEIHPGDEVALRRFGAVVVSRVDGYEDGTWVVSYFKHGEEAFENKATAHGRSVRSFLVEQGLSPRPAGELLSVRRGNPLRAAALREDMERRQHERWARRGGGDL